MRAGRATIPSPHPRSRLSWGMAAAWRWPHALAGAAPPGPHHRPCPSTTRAGCPPLEGCHPPDGSAPAPPPGAAGPHLCGPRPGRGPAPLEGRMWRPLEASVGQQSTGWQHQHNYAGIFVDCEKARTVLSVAILHGMPRLDANNEGSGKQLIRPISICPSFTQCLPVQTCAEVCGPLINA